MGGQIAAQVPDDIEARMIEPLQVVQKQHHRCFGRGQRAEVSAMMRADRACATCAGTSATGRASAGSSARSGTSSASTRPHPTTASRRARAASSAGSSPAISRASAVRRAWAMGANGVPWRNCTPFPAARRAPLSSRSESRFLHEGGLTRAGLAADQHDAAPGRGPEGRIKLRQRLAFSRAADQR